MMNWRLPKLIVGLLLLLVLAAPMLASADRSMTASISFTIENISGTVIMEALDGAPAPSTSRYDDISEGVFEITFTEPGNFFYRVYQQAGTLSNVYYDPIIYNVGIYVYTGEDGNLQYSIVLSVEGNDHKPDRIVFRNTQWPDDQTSIRVTKKAYRGVQQVTEVFAGDIITYEITVHNIGDSTAYSVHITDTLPIETPLLTLNRILDDGELSEDGKTIAWHIPRIMAGESVTVRFIVIVPLAMDDATWHNTAQVTFETPADPNASWPVASADISEHMPRITMLKEQSLNGGPKTTSRIDVKPGDQITYFLTVSNTGVILARNLTVTDLLPPTLVLDVSSISHGGREEDGVITWTLGELAQSGSVTISFKATVPDVTRKTAWINQADGSYSNAITNGMQAVDADGGYLIFFDMETNEVEAVYEPDATFTPSPSNTVFDPDATFTPSPTDTVFDPDATFTPSPTNTVFDPGATFTPSPSNTESMNATPTPSSAGNIIPPKTGDESQMPLWLALMAISFVGIGMVLILLRRKDSNEE